MHARRRHGPNEIPTDSVLVGNRAISSAPYTTPVPPPGGGVYSAPPTTSVSLANPDDEDMSAHDRTKEFRSAVQMLQSRVTSSYR